MSFRFPVALPVLVGGFLALSAVTAYRAEQLPAPPLPTAIGNRALIDQYCVACHNNRLRSGGLALDSLNVDRILENAEVWEKVVRKLRGGMMPPQGRPRPDSSAFHAFISSLETTLDRAATPDPGRAPLRRLNRTEYGNAVRDLLALDIDVAEFLPADDESDGFDNIADVLKVSPTLLEQYLAGARKISSLAVGDSAIAPITEIFRIPPDLAQHEHIDGLPLGTRGGILIRRNFPRNADYEINVVLLRNVLGYLTGLEWPHQLEITLDGERVFLAPVGGEEDNEMSDANFAAAAESIDERLKIRVPVNAGPRADWSFIPEKEFRGVGRASGITYTRSRSAEHEWNPAD